MALIKFNRTAKKAEMTDADTLYFPTDEQSIYLGGKRVGGDRVSHAAKADHATNAGHANTADSATTAGSSTSAETAATAGKLGHALELKIDGGSTKNFDGSAAVTFIMGEAAKAGVTLTIDRSYDLPTSLAVKDYVDSQIKNYTSAFRFAGILNWVDNDWYINDIPTDIVTVINQRMSLSEFVGGAADEGYMKVGHSFYVGVVSSNPVDNTFSGEIVQDGDMVTCINLYNAEGTYEPQYHVINSNITVTDSINASSPAMIPTSKAVQDAIGTAVGELDSSTSASSGNVLTGITITDGKISGKTETPMYTHPSYDATTGVPTANATPGFGGTFQVNQIASDAQGHVTSSTPRTITIPQTLASEVDRGLMSPTQFRNLNDVLDALTWK